MAGSGETLPARRQARDVAEADRDAHAARVGRWFGYSVALAAGVAVLLGVLTSLPADAPDWALNSRAVHRLEVMLAVFAVLYAILTAGFLAARGRAFTKLSVAGASVEAPEELVAVTANNDSSIVRLGFATSILLAAQEETQRRLDALEARLPTTEGQVVVAPGTEPGPKDPGEGNGQGELDIGGGAE